MNKISLSKFIEKCIESCGQVELKSTVLVDSKKHFVQVGGLVFTDRKQGIVIVKLPFMVRDWDEEVDKELYQKYNIRFSNNSSEKVNGKKVGRKKNRVDKESVIGIFYFMPKESAKGFSSGKIEAQVMKKEDVDVSYGNVRIANLFHIEMWDEITENDDSYKKYRNLSYTYFPRGRVFYNENNEKYYIILDRCLNKSTIILKICSKFNLKQGAYEIEIEPEHYECCRCSKDLDEEDYYIYNMQQVSDLVSH